MNTKRIAELIRTFADTYYSSGHPDIEMEGFRMLMNIADEIDPPARPESPIDPVEIPLRMLILQAMEEGKNIRTYYQDMVFTPVALTDLLAKGKFRWWNIANWEITDREQNYSPPITLTEPASRPLLADAEVGWVCRRRDGKWVTITEVDTDRMPIRTSDGRWYELDGTAGTIPMEKHIIHCEPLAPEGSAEWAWQMLKIGKPVTNKRVFIAGGYIKDTDSDKYHFVQMWGYSGWQLYEPEPKPEHPAINGYNRYDYIPVEGIRQPKPEPAKEPKFKVGDWAEMDYKGTLYHRQVISVHDNGIRVEFAGATPLLSFDGKNNIVSMRLVRKLDPSEVKVKITLEGTVSKDYNETLDRFILNNADGHTRNRIKWSTIDPDTAKMVQELVGE